jgi:hypothetical protein
LQKKGYLPDERYRFLKGFLRETVESKVCAYTPVAWNESVLPSPLTKLVNIFFDEGMRNILTIDSDALVRVWSLASGECVGSYPIECAKGEEMRSGEGEGTKKLTGCTVDKDFKHIVVAYETGIVQVNNLHSG